MEEPLEGRAPELVVIAGLGHAGAPTEVPLEDGRDEDDVRLGVLFFVEVEVEEVEEVRWNIVKCLFSLFAAANAVSSFFLSKLSQSKKNARASIGGQEKQLSSDDKVPLEGSRIIQLRGIVMLFSLSFVVDLQLCFAFSRSK